ncbi:MAG TPA: TolC family protein [Terriglobales bacterium]|nr:TolC family protein [Terriglobales bacterium]
MKKRNNAIIRCILLMLCACVWGSAAAAQERRITLQEAIALAQRQNHALKAASYDVAAEEQKKRMAKSGYFPSITNESNFLHITDLQRVEVPAGAFGAEIPAANVFLTQGTETFESSGTMLAQPLTQLIKIHQANKMATADLNRSQAAFTKASTDVVFRVHELYYRILTSQLQKEAAELLITSGSENLNENTDQVKNGSLLEVARIESKANLLEARQALLATDMQIADLTLQLNDALGLPLNTKLILDPNVDVALDLQPREQSLSAALNDNPEIKEATQALEKARAAHAAAKAEYIPDITAYARHSYQNGVPFLDRNFGTFGINLTYDVFDAGKRRALVRERRDEVSEAEENLQRVKDEIEVRVNTIYNRLDVARALVETRKEYVAARVENARLSEDQFKQGITLASQRDASRAQAMKARAGLLDASLAYLLARDDLNRTLGRTSP